MNAVFNPTRFGRLWRSHWAESNRAYLWFAVVAAIVNLIAIVMGLSNETDHQYSAFQFSTQAQWFAVGLFITGTIFATRYFGTLSTAGSTLTYLMRPASTFEKWLLAILITGVLFPLVYALAYMLMNFPAIVYAKAHFIPLPHTGGPPHNPPNFSFYVPFFPALAAPQFPYGPHNFRVAEIVNFLYFTSVQAFCMGGRVFFYKAATLKTTLLAFFLFISYLGMWLLLRGVTRQTTDPADFWRHTDEWLPTYTTWEVILVQAILIGVPLLLWVAVYFHLKEREVS